MNKKLLRFISILLSLLLGISVFFNIRFYRTRKEYAAAVEYNISSYLNGLYYDLDAYNMGDYYPVYEIRQDCHDLLNYIGYSSDSALGIKPLGKYVCLEDIVQALDYLNTIRLDYKDEEVIMDLTAQLMGYVEPLIPTPEEAQANKTSARFEFCGDWEGDLAALNQRIEDEKGILEDGHTDEYPFQTLQATCTYIQSRLVWDLRENDPGYEELEPDPRHENPPQR